jgi:antitoxin (DNA-binding transcriptional repressor) of toxin-antitoxin stability system
MKPVVLIVPNGKRATRVELPREVALWLRDQLTEAVGAPKRRRPVKLRRGRWREARP